MNQLATPIRVTIPHKAAANLVDFKGEIQRALDKLGCQACCSGFDILFDTERFFRMDKNLKVQPLSGITSLRAADAQPNRSILLDAAIGNDRDSLFKSIDKIAELSGCPNCHSGMDLFFSHHKDVLQASVFGNAF